MPLAGGCGYALTSDLAYLLHPKGHHLVFITFRGSAQHLTTGASLYETPMRSRRAPQAHACAFTSFGTTTLATRCNMWDSLVAAPRDHLASLLSP
ncbi:MAG: hypothetical protein OJF49_003274 [Ktedonobacterales bacterium]|nr:MAG: hypothetical protein OJF49_003274 [Ktedonobacterales bacterium]